MINASCSCSLSFVSQIAQAVHGCVHASASAALREGRHRGEISRGKELFPTLTALADWQGPGCLGLPLGWHVEHFSPALLALGKHSTAAS